MKELKEVGRGEVLVSSQDGSDICRNTRASLTEERDKIAAPDIALEQTTQPDYCALGLPWQRPSISWYYLTRLL